MLAVVIVCAALLPAADGHCAGVGFPAEQCGSGCGTGAYSPSPAAVSVAAREGVLSTPGGIAVSPDGTFFLVSNFGLSTIEMFELKHCDLQGDLVI